MRWLAVISIALGTFLVGFNEDQSRTLFTVPFGYSHGVKVTDLTGSLLIAAGTLVLLLRRPS